MAVKRASPLDEPPTASSSDEKEEVASEGEGGGSSEEEEEEEEDEDEDEEPAQRTKTSSIVPPPDKKSTPKKPPTPATTQPQPSSSESASDSGSKTGDEPTAAADVKAKSFASKPVEEDSKSSKAQPTATPLRSGTKRPSENIRPVNDVKRAKGTDAASSNGVLAAEDSRKKPDSKKLFQRLWSEDDEIAILNGMNEYRVKNGDPYKNMDAFHGFIKESLHAEFSRSQLTDKIWRLKKKYKKNATKGKNGEDPEFTKDHDKVIYDLSKRVWGSEGSTRGMEQEKSTGKAMIIKKDGRNAASPQAKLTCVSISSVDQMIKFSGLSEDVIRRGFESLEAPKRTEFEERWKNLQLLELEVFVKHAELMRDQSKLILEAYRSSNH